MKRVFRGWGKQILFVSLPVVIILILVGGYVVDYYAKALTQAGGWPITGTPQDIGLSYEDVTLKTSDGLDISAWYIPGTNSQAVIVVHGIWANKQAVLPAAAILSEVGYHVLTLDLRGHGLSEGEMQSYGYYEALDVIAGVDYLIARPEIEQVGVIGYSLGGSAVVRATALDERIQALIVQSSFSSLNDAVRDSFRQHTGLPSWPFAPLLVNAAEKELGLSVEQVSSKDALATMRARPVLIIHGEDDPLFPVSHAHQMYHVAQEPKTLWIIKNLGHGYPVDQANDYRENVVNFFQEAFGR